MLLLSHYRAVLLVTHLLAFLLGWWVRGCSEPYASVVSRVQEQFASHAPTELTVERWRTDTVTKVVYHDRVRLVHVPASVEITRSDTVVTTMPFRATLDTAVGSDTLHVAFEYPPPFWSLIDLRHAPDTARSVLERRGLDRIIIDRPTFLESTGSGALKGWALSSVLYGLNRASGGNDGLTYWEAAGVGALGGIVADTVQYFLGR